MLFRDQNLDLVRLEVENRGVVGVPSAGHQCLWPAQYARSEASIELAKCSPTDTQICTQQDQSPTAMDEACGNENIRLIPNLNAYYIILQVFDLNIFALTVCLATSVVSVTVVSSSLVPYG